MPAKAPLDENVKFLYSCLIRSDYKTIDFSRVAADFAINPAAARMRWSRLKKSINPDDTRPQFALDPLPKKVKKNLSKTPKEEKAEKEEKEEKPIKEEVKELEDAIKIKSTPRKAKLMAGRRIGVVVKNEQTSDIDDDMEDEVNSGDQHDGIADILRIRALENEQPPAAAAVSAPQEGVFKTEERDDPEPLQLAPENAQGSTRDSQTTLLLNPFGMLPMSPATLVLAPVTPILDQIAVSEKDADDDDDDGWGATIIVKQDTNPDPKTPTKRKYSATLGSASPASSMSSFSPPPSSHSSPSPSRTPRKSERTPPKWQAIVSKGRQPRSKSRKIYSEKSGDEDEGDYDPVA